MDEWKTLEREWVDLLAWRLLLCLRGAALFAASLSKQLLGKTVFSQAWLHHSPKWLALLRRIERCVKCLWSPGTIPPLVI